MTKGLSERIGKVCRFKIPEWRDRRLSDGGPHATTAWDWLKRRQYEEWGVAGGPEGRDVADWRDAQGRCVHDRSRVYEIALPEDQVDKLRQLLMEACVVFYQECIYLDVAGEAERVYPPPGTWPELDSK